MTQLAITIYIACVDFLLRAAAPMGITYRDANAALFFIIWPVVTALLLIIITLQGLLLHRRSRKN
ncbi:MAG TPA: hypothetical protein PLA87_15070 [Pseudomonadota bacterium]|jgi:hypothetical protein|nr:hypothetical protein [Pseudomonadota bacterium]